MPGSTASRVAKSPAPPAQIRRVPNTAPKPGDTSRLHPLLHLQQTVGNRAVARIIQAAQNQRPPALKPRGSRAADVIQRDIGVEFQARNVISQKKGKKKFERTQTKRKPLRTVGDLTMEVDTGSVMEFGTGHYKVWSQLKKDLDEVSAIITEIKGLPKEALDPTKPVAPDNPRVFRGFQTDHGKVDVTVEPTDFRGKPQTNEEIVLSEFGSMLKQDQPGAVAPVEASTKAALGKAATPNLTNFMRIIVFHLQSLQRDDPDLVMTASGKIKQPKAFLLLMNKTDYTAMFQVLTASEQNEFQNLVNADPNPIATAVGASMTDDLFKVGYWGWHPDRRGMRVLIKAGKIAMIEKQIPRVTGQGANNDIHKCGDPGVPRRYCKTKNRIEQVTVGAWLKSMIKPSKRTKKSITAPLPTYTGSKSGGFSWGLSKVTSPGMFLFEMRGHPGMPIADWLNFAEEKFNFAANCRPGSKLTYDGKKPKPIC